MLQHLQDLILESSAFLLHFNRLGKGSGKKKSELNIVIIRFIDFRIFPPYQISIDSPDSKVFTTTSSVLLFYCLNKIWHT